ncbi:MAG: ATPase [Lachnospiraceae bacterium]|jgi:sugar (pentulose or hexulose) kinase|nr:ATPase [Lachnospiraceae bacterium]
MSDKKLFLGIELGSTRIKAVLVDETFAPLAAGAHEWENRREGGYWTYSLEAVKEGVQEAYARLAAGYKEKTGATLTHLDSLGVSAMMHGYLAFDREMNLLVPFRTWRNTTTGPAAEALTSTFAFNIPQRWSIAHLYQAILNNESHIKDIDFLTTLAGYVHYCLTGEKVLGVGDASGMFLIDSEKLGYDQAMADKFRKMTGININDILPRIQKAGETAGQLTAAGAKYLDPTGALQPGVPLCPPEGDAGTGMVATNSVAARTGNVSAGTSVFAMLVMEKPLAKVYPEIDIVTTPHGKPVAMVHCNTCTSDLDAWIRLFGEAAALLGAKPDKEALYGSLYKAALAGKPDGGGLLNYNFFSGEPVAGLYEGCPMFMRRPDAAMCLADFMRVQVYSAVASLRLGMDILAAEGVGAECLLGHGGLFKAKDAGQRLVAAALGIPVAVMEQAGEGGAWGIALLAAYTASGGGLPLEGFLAERVFAGSKGQRVLPDAEDVAGFNAFLARYKKGLDVARMAAAKC